MSQDVTSLGVEDLQGTSIGRKSLLDSNDAAHWYMVMDFIKGEKRDSRLEQRQQASNELLPQDKVLDIARQLCDVLKYLHSHEPIVVFRDLKPGNIMLSPTDQLYLIDFG